MDISGYTDLEPLDLLESDNESLKSYEVLYRQTCGVALVIAMYTWRGQMDPVSFGSSGASE